MKILSSMTCFKVRCSMSCSILDNSDVGKKTIYKKRFIKFLIVGSSAPSQLVFGILRFRINIWHFIKAFR